MKIGLLDDVRLRKLRLYWVVVSLVIPAFNPWSGDPALMLLMALALWGLCEISVLFARCWHRRDRKREQA